MEAAEGRARELYEANKRLEAHVHDLESRKRAPLYQKKQEVGWCVCCAAVGVGAGSGRWMALQATCDAGLGCWIAEWRGCLLTSVPMTACGRALNCIPRNTWHMNLPRSQQKAHVTSHYPPVAGGAACGH